MALYRIIYTDELPEGIGGTCTYPWYPQFGTCVIRIRPKYTEDLGIRLHEICHAKQYADDFFHALKYKFIQSYRYKCEIEAYTEQIKAYRYKSVEQATWIITALMNKYNLAISVNTIISDVKRIIDDTTNTSSNISNT